MGNTVEKVIEMPQITEEQNYSKIIEIGYEVISMIFEVLISFVSIVLYWLVFYLSDTEIDYFEHIKNGSIIWIFFSDACGGEF